MKRIMDAEAAAIRDIAITDAFEDGVQLLMATPGRVITTGIGKAGLSPENSQQRLPLPVPLLFLFIQQKPVTVI